MGYRTILAYRHGDHRLRANHYSNPRVNFKDVPTGDAETADAARRMTEIRFVIGAIGDESETCTTLPALTTTTTTTTPAPTQLKHQQQLLPPLLPTALTMEATLCLVHSSSRTTGTPESWPTTPSERRCCRNASLVT